MKNKKNRKFLWILLAVAVLLAALLLMRPAAQEEDQPQQETEAQAAAQDIVFDEAPKGPLVGNALQVQEIGSYTGIYVEDGSDEPVANLLMMVVTNVTAEPIQYANIEVDLGEETARFTLSALPAGKSAVLIEQNRMKYSDSVDYYAAETVCTNLAGFDRPLSLQEEKLKIQLLEAGVNIINNTQEDITGTIVLYYKNVNNGVYHGGITYRIRLEGGLKAGELRQIMADHIQFPGTELLFVDIVE